MYETLKPDFIGRDRFEKILMKKGFRVKYHKNYVRTTIPGCYKYPNLIEGGLLNNKNQVWQSDISYILVNGSFCYLVFIIDVYSRRIVGYQASNHMRTQANISALKQAFKIRSKEPLNKLIHHSDRGGQYGSDLYKSKLHERGIKVSMGLRATENAYAERINRTIKNEYLKYWKANSLNELKRHLKKAVKHYNQKRNHKLIGKISPIQYEKNLILLKDNNRPQMIIHTYGNRTLKKAYELLDSEHKRHNGAFSCPVL